MTTRSKTINRLLSLALCICMVLALLPAIPLVVNAANIPAGTVLYLKPNSNWTQANAWFAAYFFNNSTNKNYWVKMTDSDGDGIYECQVPDGTWPNVIFCRMNPASTNMDWNNKWNQTADLTFDGTKDLYTVKAGTWDNGGGTWGFSCQFLLSLHSFENEVCTNCGTKGRTIYFQNNWEWEDVCVHYIKDDIKSGWPGFSAKYFGEATIDGVIKYYNVITVPEDAEIIINGWDENRPSKRDETVAIKYADCEDGSTYYINESYLGDQGQTVCRVATYPICKDFINEHKFVEYECTRCEVEYCQVYGHIDEVGNEDFAADNDDACDRCGDELMDIFFKNDWYWTDITLYYWYSENDKITVPADPGLSMTWYGENHGYDYYRMKVPTDIEGFIVSGKVDGQRVQTEDIKSGWYDGATYFPDKDAGDQKCTVDNFPVCVDFPSNHHYEDGSDKCAFCGNPKTVTIYFQNNWLWTNVEMHYSGSRIAANGGAEVVLQASEDPCADDGTYQYYCWTIPADPDQIWFTGEKNDGSGLNQSPYITSGWKQDITYYMDWDDGNKVGSFMITEKFPCIYGHTEEIIPGLDPTCVDTGWTAGVKCSVCDKTLTEREEIPATGNHTDVSKEDGRCDVCNCLIHDVYLAYTTASLKGNIAVNYFMLLSDEVLADDTAYIQFAVEGDEPVQIPASQGKPEGDYYMFTYEVSAKEMTDVIHMQFFFEGTGVFEDEHPYNVRAYAKHILQSNSDEDTRNLMEAMVNYGAAAQTYFGYNANNPDDLANAFLNTKPDYSGKTISGIENERGQGTALVKFHSASLILKSETTVRFFFNGPISATYQGQTLEVKQRGGLYYVDVVGISAKALDEKLTVTIDDGTETADISFIPLSYCQSVWNDTTGAFNDDIKNLVYALYEYNQAANVYFKEG